MPATSTIECSSATSSATSTSANRSRPSRLTEDDPTNSSKNNLHLLSYKTTCMSTSPSLHHLFSPSSHLPPDLSVESGGQSNFTTSATTTRRSRRSASTTGIRSRISLDEDSVRALVEQEEQRLRSRREQAFADQRKDWTLPSSHSGSSFSGTSSIHSFSKERDSSRRRSITRQSYSLSACPGTSGNNGNGGGGSCSTTAGGVTSVFTAIGPFASGSISAANTPGTEDSDHLTFTRNLHTAQSHHHHLQHHHMPHSQGSSREGRSSSSSLGMGAVPNGIIRTSNGWLQRKIHLRPQLRGIHLITDELMKQLPEIADFLVGMCHIQVMHTSASLALNENWDPEVRADMEMFLNSMVPESTQFRHSCEGPDDMPAHIKACFLGSSLSIPVTDGKLNLGSWQGIWLCEHRNKAGSRKIIVTINGALKE